jgi:Uma2 family endonuclease
MVAVTEQPPEHIVLPHISWNTFERVLDEIGKARFRIAYLNGNLEMMKVHLEHNHVGQLIGRLIFFAAVELNTPLCSGGSTTLKEPRRKVGIEPDECFWIKHEKHMRGRKRWNARIDPPPDLAVEIDITTNWLDRLEIYAALKVPEIWRFDGERLRLLILGANGKYRQRTKSVAFPSLPMDGLGRFVKKLGSADEVSLIRDFTGWLRTNVSEKKPSPERKNGRR